MAADRILTRNRMGWSSGRLSALSAEFVTWCSQNAIGRPVLDIGTGHGAAAVAALSTGATVIANDMDAGHLEELQALVPEGERHRLVVKPGRFPRQINFDLHSLGAVHASNVLHFLTPRQLEEGFRAIARWLAPGGRLFVQAATPFQKPFQNFLPEYERRIAAGDPWPGWIPKISVYSSHRQLSQMPRSLHLLDDAVLTRIAAEAGLPVIKAWLYRRQDLPASLHLDGREVVGLIAADSATHS